MDNQIVFDIEDQYYGNNLILRALEETFEKRKIIVNHNPKWLNGLEIDFYVIGNGKKFAFELQGPQHYCPQDNFGGVQKFFKQYHNDKLKHYILKSKKIQFITIPYDSIIHSLNGFFKIRPISQKLTAEIRRYEHLMKNKYGPSDKNLTYGINVISSMQKTKGYDQIFEKYAKIIVENEIMAYKGRSKHIKAKIKNRAFKTARNLLYI